MNLLNNTLFFLNPAQTHFREKNAGLEDIFALFREIFNKAPVLLSFCEFT